MKEISIMKPRVFITRPIPDSVLSRIEEIASAEMWPTSAEIPPIADRLPALDGLLTYGHERVTDDMMATAPRLKVIANMGVGTDHIDSQAARARGIQVGNTPGVLSETTADMTFALLLAAARNVFPSARHVRDGNWAYYDPNAFWGRDVHHATLGIAGMGRIGFEVAKRALGFQMRVLYFKRTRRLDWERELGIEYAELDRLLQESDFVSLHTPLTAETRGLIGRRELALMKPTAILVNAARGGVVDHGALFEALSSGRLGGAALDVTEPEPIPPDHPLLSLDNVLICPHLGSATVQTRMKMATMACENLIAGLTGQPLPYSVFR